VCLKFSSLLLNLPPFREDVPCSHTRAQSGVSTLLTALTSGKKGVSFFTVRVIDSLGNGDQPDSPTPKLGCHFLWQPSASRFPVSASTKGFVPRWLFSVTPGNNSWGNQTANRSRSFWARWKSPHAIDANALEWGSGDLDLAFLGGHFTSLTYSGIIHQNWTSEKTVNSPILHKKKQSSTHWRFLFSSFRKCSLPGMVVHACNPGTQRLKQEDCDLCIQHKA
jgi:hypothetical protein